MRTVGAITAVMNHHARIMAITEAASVTAAIPTVGMVDLASAIVPV